nr:allantoinase AllB [Bacteroidota bacterium]
MENNLIIKSNNIITPQGIVAGAVVIKNGIIIDVVAHVDVNENFMLIDAGDNIVMPGIIDPHVHINEPGRTEWEGFETATKAAAAGGITTMIEMPLNASPVTTTKNNFELKLAAAKNKLNVNCGFWGGVIPGNEYELEALLDAGVFGLKAFLTHSGIDDFPNAHENELRNALRILKKYNRPLLVHCELDAANADAHLLENNPRSYDAYLKSRPKAWENNAIKMMIDLCRETEAHVHIVHLSSSEALPMIAIAKKEGLPLTVETAQHYLFFAAENIADGATEYKCAPPIREQANNDLLWDALQIGLIDFVATDHSPAPPAMKEMQSGNFAKAWGGIAGLQFSLPAMWTRMKEKNIDINNIAKWMCSNPAKFIQLQNSKGKIEKGYDADIVIWNSNQNFIVTESMIEHRHKITPYVNQNLCGKVMQTFLKGVPVFDNGHFINLHSGKLFLNRIK